MTWFHANLHDMHNFLVHWNCVCGVCPVCVACLEVVKLIEEEE